MPTRLKNLVLVWLILLLGGASTQTAVCELECGIGVASSSCHSATVAAGAAMHDGRMHCSRGMNPQVHHRLADRGCTGIECVYLAAIDSDGLGRVPAPPDVISWMVLYHVPSIRSAQQWRGAAQPDPLRQPGSRDPLISRLRI